MGKESTKRKGAFEFSNFSGQELGRGQRSSWLMGETTVFTSLYLLEASNSSQEDPSIVGPLVCPSTKSEADRAVSVVCAFTTLCTYVSVMGTPENTSSSAGLEGSQEKRLAGAAVSG